TSVAQRLADLFIRSGGRGHEQVALRGKRRRRPAGGTDGAAATDGTDSQAVRESGRSVGEADGNEKGRSRLDSAPWRDARCPDGSGQESKESGFCRPKGAPEVAHPPPR